MTLRLLDKLPDNAWCCAVQHRSEIWLVTHPHALSSFAFRSHRLQNAFDDEQLLFGQLWCSAIYRKLLRSATPLQSTASAIRYLQFACSYRLLSALSAAFPSMINTLLHGVRSVSSDLTSRSGSSEPPRHGNEDEGAIESAPNQGGHFRAGLALQF